MYEILSNKKVERLSKVTTGPTHKYGTRSKTKASANTVENLLKSKNLSVGGQRNLEDKNEKQLLRETQARATDRDNEDLSDTVQDHFESKNVSHNKLVLLTLCFLEKTQG